MPAETELRHAFGTWLDTYHWDWWCTLTYRTDPARHQYPPTRGSTALHHFLRFARIVERNSRERNRLGYFAGVETGAWLGRVHLHALIHLPSFRGGDVYPSGKWEAHLRMAAWKSWFTDHGRALILPFERGLGATHYITKYTVKALADWDIGGHCVGIEEQDRSAGTPDGGIHAAGIRE